MSEFDPSEYMRAPVMSVSGGIMLARALVNSKPPNMPRNVDRFAKKLSAVADTAQEILALRQRAAGDSEEGTRVVDGDADSSWSVFRMRLEACALLPDEYEEAERARRLLQVLFGNDGLTFLRERYSVQYIVADTILKRIQSDGLQAEIDELAGPQYLENIRAQHERYGSMVQDMLKRDQAQEENLRDHRRHLQRAITAYAVNMCATVDDEDSSTVERARAALRPIVNFRQQLTRGRGNSAADTEPETPAEPPEPDTSS